MGNQETGLGRSLRIESSTETGKRAGPLEKEKQLKMVRESDHLIVLRDGRADHMGKGVTVICSLQRKLAPDNVGSEHVELTNAERSAKHCADADTLLFTHLAHRRDAVTRTISALMDQSRYAAGNFLVQEKIL